LHPTKTKKKIEIKIGSENSVVITAQDLKCINENNPDLEVLTLDAEYIDAVSSDFLIFKKLKELNISTWSVLYEDTELENVANLLNCTIKTSNVLTREKLSAGETEYRIYEPKTLKQTQALTPPHSETPS